MSPLSPSDAKPSTPFTVGLTGGIGSGKTTVADLFAERGVAVVDTDLIAHQLTAPNGIAIAAIRAEFGDAFIDTGGAMDRKKMREYVFSDPLAKQRLEAILHPLIGTETARAIAQANGHYVMPVIPLLVESGKWQQRFTRILVIDCDEQTQIQRVMQRNAMNETQVRAIMAAQATRQQRLEAADDVIVNNAGVDALAPQIERLHAFYMSLAACH
ncbi:dephospho-CoA kinase [Glaciimonas sp. PCH181]|uniref:dephospho-CoA kinase n=1 Tax=Glaciimonas sp. PCH181 TaxID=2133943 RepID=UPI000D352043|nr:dephospho-CoA kinase [Glaciimonas sp. PCH181]PUA16378.1 dephospho-CoA kinase [Glaciimonas sp. PCH181]